LWIFCNWRAFNCALCSAPFPLVTLALGLTPELDTLGAGLAGLLERIEDVVEPDDADVCDFGYLYGTYSFFFGGGAVGVGKNGNGSTTGSPDAVDAGRAGGDATAFAAFSAFSLTFCSALVILDEIQEPMEREGEFSGTVATVDIDQRLRRRGSTGSSNKDGLNVDVLYVDVLYIDESTICHWSEGTPR
jgi:hypothetical protein